VCTTGRWVGPLFSIPRSVISVMDSTYGGVLMGYYLFGACRFAVVAKFSRRLGTYLPTNSVSSGLATNTTQPPNIHPPTRGPNTWYVLCWWEKLGNISRYHIQTSFLANQTFFSFLPFIHLQNSATCITGCLCDSFAD
jgi:hypothetical protein